MHHWFIPTTRNNFRARLLKVPALIVLSIFLFLGNTVIGFVPVTHVNAQVTPQDLLDMHNQQRKLAGLAPLRLSTALSVSAQKKAQAMLGANCWSHYCPDNKSPWDFFAEAGYSYLYAGENLAEGYFTNADAMTAWMNSTTHRENILRPEYEEIGFGIVRGDFQSIKNNVLIVVHFGTPQPQTSASISGVDIYNDNIPKPQILKPLEGSFLSDLEVQISGLAPDSNQVRIKDGYQTLDTVDANKGSFTYKAKLPEKEYSITAIGESGTRTSAASDPVKFTVDRTSDPVQVSDVSLLALSEKTVQVAITRPNLDKVQFKFPDGWVDFRGPILNVWSINIDRELLDTSSVITLTTVDKAGNSWTGTVDLKVLLEKRTDLKDMPPEKTPPVTKAGFDIVFLTILAGLYFLDYIVLKRTGVTRKATSSHLHLGILLITLIIIGSGLLAAGSIGTGLAI
jgi:hypothetical protein